MNRAGCSSSAGRYAAYHPSRCVFVNECGRERGRLRFRFGAEPGSGGAAPDAAPPQPERTPPRGFRAGAVLVRADMASGDRCQ
jgi:hypothetical protein